MLTDQGVQFVCVPLGNYYGTWKNDDSSCFLMGKLIQITLDSWEMLGEVDLEVEMVATATDWSLLRALSPDHACQSTGCVFVKTVVTIYTLSTQETVYLYCMWGMFGRM